MNFYAFISLLAFLICIFLGNFIYHKNNKSQLNRWVAILCFFVGFLSFIEFQYRQAATLEKAYFWLNLSTLWPFVPSLLLHISIIFTKNHWLKNKAIYLIIYLPALFIFLLGFNSDLLIGGASQEYWGWTFEFPKNLILFKLMSIWTIIAAFLAGALCFVYYLRSKHMKKLQAKYFFSGLYLPLLISVLTDLILPVTTVRVPEMTMTMSTVGIAFISYGIWKHKFPAITSALVADKIVSTMSNFLLLVDENKNILNINKSTADILGYDEQELVGEPVEKIFYQEKDIPHLFKENEISFSYPTSVINLESRIKTVKGNIIPVILSLSPIMDENSNIIAIVCIGSDVQDLITAQEKIKISLKEKEVLLREIHHRVKNNLQIISSLLNLQSRYIKDEDDLELFRDSQSRVKSMAIIHEKLYQSPDFAHVDFKEYLSSLMNYLFQYYSIDPNLIKLNLEVEDLMLGMDTAIPCGLIVNELVSNSLKYAFPPGSGGEISITLNIENNNFLLEVADNGIGLPENVDLEKTGTLGLRLVVSLTEQINGNINLIRDSGTKFEISFAEVEYNTRI